MLALPNRAGLLLSPSSPGPAQLACIEKECLGTKVGVTIHGTAHTVQLTQATTKPCHSDRGPRPPSVTKVSNTPPPQHRVLHGVISPQSKSWLYCEICEYRTNNTKPGKARRRFLTHIRLQHEVPRQVVQVPVKSHLPLDMPLPSPESRLASRRTEKRDTLGIADMDQTQSPALLLQVLSEDLTAVLCSSPQPVPCCEVEMNMSWLGTHSLGSTTGTVMGDKQEYPQQQFYKPTTVMGSAQQHSFLPKQPAQPKHLLVQCKKLFTQPATKKLSTQPNNMKLSNKAATKQMSPQPSKKPGPPCKKLFTEAINKQLSVQQPSA